MAVASRVSSELRPCLPCANQMSAVGRISIRQAALPVALIVHKMPRWQAERVSSGSRCSVAPCRVSLSEQEALQSVPCTPPEHLPERFLSHCWRKALTSSLALCLALLAYASPPPALAQLQTVAPSQATESAKALPQQKVEKGKVWLIFLAGAATLFGGTVLLENNESLFPAIAKSNKIMAASRKASQEVDQSALQEISDERLENAVAAGLLEARQKTASEQRPAAELMRDGSQTEGNGAVPAPDSLEASETSKTEETYASTHQ